MVTSELRIVSQNVAKRLRKSARALLTKLVRHAPHAIALQEITIGQVDGWCALLSAAGYDNVVRGVGYGATGGALLASHLPISAVQLHWSAEAGPRIAAGVVGGISLASVYFPQAPGLPAGPRSMTT